MVSFARILSNAQRRGTAILHTNDYGLPWKCCLADLQQDLRGRTATGILGGSPK
jgi:hypothetical protein